MTDIELLPLVGTLRAMPEHVQGVVQAYARANVAHHTAAKDAEIEALRAEREVIGAEAVKYAGKSGRLEARAERLAEALDAVVTFAVCYQLSEGDQCVVDARALLHPAAAQEGK